MKKYNSLIVITARGDSKVYLERKFRPSSGIF